MGPRPFHVFVEVGTQFLLRLVLKSHLLPPHTHMHTFFLSSCQGSSSRESYLGGRTLTNEKSDTKFCTLENKNCFKPLLLHRRQVESSPLEVVSRDIIPSSVL